MRHTSLWLVLAGFASGIATSIAIVYLPVQANESARQPVNNEAPFPTTYPTPRPPPKLQAPPQPAPNPPPEPDADQPPAAGTGLGICWFAPNLEDLGEKCRATFTICREETPDGCNRWLWITCRDKYVFIGPHSFSLSASEYVIAGIPFVTYSVLPIIVLYNADAAVPNPGAYFSLFNFNNRNRYGACMVVMPGATPRSTPAPRAHDGNS